MRHTVGLARAPTAPGPWALGGDWCRVQGRWGMLGGACMRALSNGRDGEPRLPWREGGPVCAGVR